MGCDTGHRRLDVKPDMGETWRLGQSRKVDGRTVRYDVVGAGAPVVVVHGAPWLSFNRQMTQADAAYSDIVQPHYGSIDEPSLVLWGRPIRGSQARRDGGWPPHLAIAASLPSRTRASW